MNESKHYTHKKNGLLRSTLSCRVRRSRRRISFGEMCPGDADDDDNDVVIRSGLKMKIRDWISRQTDGVYLCAIMCVCV